MFQTKVSFFEGQTPEQRKAHVEDWRRRDAQVHRINNLLGFWRVCEKPRCRRDRTCSHDMHACFKRIWALVPPDQKEWLRGAVVARQGGATVEEAARAAEARRAAYLKSQEPKLENVQAPVVPAEPPVDARIRRL